MPKWNPATYSPHYQPPAQPPTMKSFIAENREELRTTILGICDNVGELTDDDIEQWVANDEGLWNMAIAAGVNVYEDDEEDDDQE